MLYLLGIVKLEKGNQLQSNLASYGENNYPRSGQDTQGSYFLCFLSLSK